MPTLKKLPWLSLALVLLAYTSLGWLLSSLNGPVVVWVIIIIGILLLSASLSSQWSKIRDSLAQLFKSDTRAFLFAVTSAFLIVLMLTWFHIFAHALLVISAGTLFRIDAQIAGLNSRQTFWILLIVSLGGLGLGAVAQTLIIF